jgi:excisionase family DNA binding protein
MSEDMASRNGEVTLKQAADLLNVSHQYLTRLLESGHIPSRLVDSHTYVRMSDLLAYKTGMDLDAERAFADLVEQAQELGLGYA